MPSIQLQIRKTNQDFTDKAERRVINGEDELPEEVRKQINSPEKFY